MEGLTCRRSNGVYLLFFRFKFPTSSSQSATEPESRDNPPQSNSVLVLPQHLARLVSTRLQLMVARSTTLYTAWRPIALDASVVLFSIGLGPWGQGRTLGGPSGGTRCNCCKSPRHEIHSGFPLLTAAGCHSPLLLIGHEAPEAPSHSRILPFRCCSMSSHQFAEYVHPSVVNPFG